MVIHDEMHLFIKAHTFKRYIVRITMLLATYNDVFYLPRLQQIILFYNTN